MQDIHKINQRFMNRMATENRDKPFYEWLNWLRSLDRVSQLEILQKPMARKIIRQLQRWMNNRLFDQELMMLYWFDELQKRKN